MQRLLDRLAGCVLLFGIAACGIEEVEGFERLYHRHCAVCHGADLQGAAQGTPLVGIDLAYGGGIDNIARSIAAGMPDRGMPAWSEDPLGDPDQEPCHLHLRGAHQHDLRRLPHRDAACRTDGSGPHVAARLPSRGRERRSRPASLRHRTPAGWPHPAHREDARPSPWFPPPASNRISCPGHRFGHGGAVQFGPLQYGNGWVLDVALHPNYADQPLDLSQLRRPLRRLRRPKSTRAGVDDQACPRPAARRCLDGPADHLRGRQGVLQLGHRHGDGRTHLLRRRGPRLPEPRHESRPATGAKARSTGRQDPPHARRRAGARGQSLRRRTGRVSDHLDAGAIAVPTVSSSTWRRASSGAPRWGRGAATRSTG